MHRPTAGRARSLRSPADAGAKPKGRFLLLWGWERYALEEVAAEYRRKREAGEELWLLADDEVRFRYPRLGISGTNMKEALGLELVGAARDLGG